MNVFDEILSDNPSQTIPEKQFKTNTTTIDPRPDLTQDHRHWVRILTNAQAFYDTHSTINGGQTSLYKIIHGIRCGGAILEETRHGYKLHPGNEEWVLPEEWEKVKRRWLDPVKDDLLKLFKLSKLGQVTNEDLPPGIFPEKSKLEFGVQESLFK